GGGRAVDASRRRWASRRASAASAASSARPSRPSAEAFSWANSSFSRSTAEGLMSRRGMVGPLGLDRHFPLVRARLSSMAKRPQTTSRYRRPGCLKQAGTSALITLPLRLQRSRRLEKTTMTRARFITALCVLAIIAGATGKARSQETLKVAIPQRGAWDAGIADLGQRGGIFKKHGLNLEILYVQAGPESIQALIGGSMD